MIYYLGIFVILRSTWENTEKKMSWKLFSQKAAGKTIKNVFGRGS